MLKKTVLLTILLLSAFYQLAAQKNTLRGVVTDTLNQPLSGATVMLLQPADSTLVKFGITGNKGQFLLEKLPEGSFLLQIAYLGYENWEREVVSGKSLTDSQLGVIPLRPLTAVLSTVEVKADYVPLRIKKDTIEYNAAAFGTKLNAVVEDLLKKLPGVTVDRNGTIKAQGETVKKVLVDGKEFFGDDPKMATQNLPADAIDRVQVFDKKSDMAEFSGIEDGQGTITINLSLKEDKKKGYFGKVKGGASPDRYEGKLNVNRFGQKVQTSILGMFNNTNEPGFSFNDYINMMGGLGNLMNGGGSMSLNSEEVGLPLDSGRKNQGFTTTNAGGVNLNTQLSKKTKLHASYFLHALNANNDLEGFQTNIVGSRQFANRSAVETHQQKLGHRFNTNVETKIDPTQTLKWRTNLGWTAKQLTSEGQGFTIGQNADLENKTHRTRDNESTNFRLSSNLTYLKKFAKKGRLLTTSFGLERGETDGTGTLQATNQFFTSVLMIDSLWQQQTDDNQLFNHYLGATFTEPIGKTTYLTVNYDYQKFDAEQEREVADIMAEASFFNPQLSNHFRRKFRAHLTGLNIRRVRKKWKANVGVQLQQSVLDGLLSAQDIQLKKRFINVLPKASFNYDFKTSRSLRLDYQTSVRPPAVAQLQPIVNNSNPLNLIVGNPDLRPEYLHTLRLNFNSFDQFSSIHIFARAGLTVTDDKILNARTIDEQFRQTTTPVNFGQTVQYNTYVSFGAPLKFLRSRFDLVATAKRERGNFLVNNLASKYENQRLQLDASISNKNTEKVDLLVGYQWTQNHTKYLGSSQPNIVYSDQLLYGDLSLHLKDTWTLSNSLDAQYYSAAVFGKATRRIIWSLSLNHHFLASKRGTLSLSVEDILNQNVGINRYSQLNFAQEQRIQSLGRYFLVSFTYALSKFGKENITIKQRGR
ncbi:MAG: TonB-dependent receptor [Bacteroidota bacterium]